MERIQWEETPRLGVTKGITLRFCPIPFLERPERVMGRISRQETSQLVQHREQGRTDSPQVLIDLC
jgi:hypothetical protein